MAAPKRSSRGAQRTGSSSEPVAFPQTGWPAWFDAAALPAGGSAYDEPLQARRCRLRIEALRDKAAHVAFTQLVLDGGWELAAGPAHEFRFAKHF